MARAQGATISVNSTAQSVAPTGNANGMCELAEAIRAANADTAVDGCTAGSGADLINLPAGTYTLAAVDNTGGQFGAPLGLPPITGVLRIAGQAGNAADVIIERAAGAPAFIFSHLGSGTTLTLENLTLRRGAAPAGMEGGALTVNGATLTLNNVVVESCVAPANSRGGAITTTGFTGTLTLSDTLMRNNVGPEGSGVFFAGPVNIVRSTFEANAANAGFGGAIRLGQSGYTVLISDSAFGDNSSTAGGGAISFGGTSNVTIRRSRFSGNSTTAAGSCGGGAISNGGGCGGVGSNLTISESTFWGNTTSNNGGAIESYGRVVVRNTTFSGNKAGVAGGALYVLGTSAAVMNHVTATQNIADSDNNGTGNGGAVFLEGSTASLLLSNTVLAGNLDTGLEAPDCASAPGALGLTSGGYNVVGEGTGCGGFQRQSTDRVGTAAARVDPSLAPLADNGGPDAGFPTAAVPSLTHGLYLGSLLIDSANPAPPDGGFSTCEAVDQRGAVRPAGSRCDVGAFEGQVAFPAADLSVTQTDTPDPVVLGAGSVVYSIAAANGSAVTATGVTLSCALPSGAAFVSATTSQGNCTRDGGSLMCVLGSVDGGASTSTVVTVTPTAVGTLTLVSTVSGNVNDSIPANNTAIEMTTVVADSGQPDAGSADAGRPDAGAVDAGSPDAGPRDAGPRDAGSGQTDGGDGIHAPQGCGCTSGADGALALLVLALRNRAIAARRSRRVR